MDGGEGDVGEMIWERTKVVRIICVKENGFLWRLARVVELPP